MKIQIKVNTYPPFFSPPLYFFPISNRKLHNTTSIEASTGTLFNWYIDNRKQQP